MSMYFVPDTMLLSGDTRIIKADIILAIRELTIKKAIAVEVGKRHFRSK